MTGHKPTAEEHQGRDCAWVKKYEYPAPTITAR